MYTEGWTLWLGNHTAESDRPTFVDPQVVLGVCRCSHRPQDVSIVIVTDNEKILTDICAVGSTFKQGGANKFHDFTRSTLFRSKSAPATTTTRAKARTIQDKVLLKEEKNISLGQDPKARDPRVDNYNRK